MNPPRGIDCDEAVRRLAGYLDRELDPALAEDVERHLETCRSCFSRAQFERRLRDRIRQDLQAHPVPPGFEERVRRLVRSLPQHG